MGFKCEFNYILKLSSNLPISQLQRGAIISFEKDEHRVYPVDSPIDLADVNWEVIARGIVTEFTVGHGKTSGKFKILLVYDDNQRKTITTTVAESERLNGREI